MAKLMIDIVLDGPAGPPGEGGCLLFVEAERDGRSAQNIGEWVTRPDGLQALRFEDARPLRDALQQILEHPERARELAIAALKR
jgi:hypothetical protein